MDAFDQLDPLLLGCAAFAVLGFAVREVAAGLFRALGGDLWRWAKRRRAR